MKRQTIRSELHKTSPFYVMSNIMKDHEVQGCWLVRPQNRTRLISGSSEDSWNKLVSQNLIYTLLYNVFLSPFPVNVIVSYFCPPATRLHPISVHLPCCSVASSSVTNVAIGCPKSRDRSLDDVIS